MSRRDPAVLDAQNIILNRLKSLNTACGATSDLTTSKNFGTRIPCFSLSVTTLVVSIWFHNLRTITGSNVWPLCSAHALRHLQAGTAWVVILPPPYLCQGCTNTDTKADLPLVVLSAQTKTNWPTVSVLNKTLLKAKRTLHQHTYDSWLMEAVSTKICQMTYINFIQHIYNIWNKLCK